MSPVEVVIHHLGIRPLARKLNRSPQMISRWRERTGLVPSEYHKEIIALADGKISPEDLVYGRPPKP
jgi:hypothetical protein